MKREKGCASGHKNACRIKEGVKKRSQAHRVCTQK
jgi:hypothetical protein